MIDMNDNIRVIHINGRVWKWELKDWKKFPIVEIRSEYGAKYKESAAYFVKDVRRFISYRVNIVPSMIEKYICEKILKIGK